MSIGVVLKFFLIVMNIIFLLLMFWIVFVGMFMFLVVLLVMMMVEMGELVGGNFFEIGLV